MVLVTFITIFSQNFMVLKTGYLVSKYLSSWAEGTFLLFVTLCLLSGIVILKLKFVDLS